MDPLPYHRTVGAIGIVFATTPTIIVPRPDAKSERANLNACTIRVHASINLSRGGNRSNEQRAGGHSQEHVPHNILLLALRTQRFSRADVAAAKKFLKSWNHGPFLYFRHCCYPESSALRPLRQSRHRSASVSESDCILPWSSSTRMREHKGSGRAFISVAALEFFNPIRRWRRRRPRKTSTACLCPASNRYMEDARTKAG